MVRLTESNFLSKVMTLGREPGDNSRYFAAHFFRSHCWEVVQSAVHQTLTLIILVRVQASQPNFLSRAKPVNHALLNCGLNQRGGSNLSINPRVCCT
jgi:hypothetical protein